MGCRGNVREIEKYTGYMYRNEEYYCENVYNGQPITPKRHILWQYSRLKFATYTST